jgi:hypothetical protein
LAAGTKQRKSSHEGSAFFTFLASGGIILLVIVGGVLALAINLIYNKLTK